MRFNLDTVDGPKAVSMALKRRLTELGYQIGHGAAYGIAARMFGYRSWRDLRANVGVEQRDLFDEAADPSIVVARRAYHVAVLVRWGVGYDHAAGLVNEIRPTSGGREAMRA